MSRSSRIFLSIVFSILLVLGIGLIFVSRLDPVVLSYNSQKTVCNFEYSIQLSPTQSRSNDCAVLQNDWLQLAVKSNQNISFSIALTKVGGGQLTLFNNTGTNLNASFPIRYNGAIIAKVTNSALNVSEINGSLSVLSAAIANTTTLNTVFPYRTVGEGLVGIGALAILLMAWNPQLSGYNPTAIVKRENISHQD